MKVREYRMKEKEKEITEKKGSGKKAGIIVGAILGGLLVIYLGVGIFYEFHFFPGSTVNGVNSSSASLTRVKERIRAQVDGYEISIIERSGNISTLDSREIGLTVDTETGAIEDLLKKQNGLGWLPAIFNHRDYVSESLVSVDRQTLETSLRNLPLMKDSHQTKTENASIAFDGSRFVVEKEVYGTELNESAFIDYMYDAIISLHKTVDLDQEKVYVQPTVLSDDATLNAEAETLNESLEMTVTYDTGDVVDASLIEKWISVGDNGEVVYDEAAIGEYVQDLASRVDTVGTVRTFTATGGSTVSVEGGTYGWKVDVEGETAQLIEDLKAGKDVSRDIVYESKGASHNGVDWGNSFVEVDIDRQHVWLYVDGSLVVQSDCVTGNLKRNKGTHTGAWAMEYKQANRILKGGEEEVEVKYWMPFYAGEGLHDAWWKKSFGGDQYIDDGSHGCVNLPSSVAKTIFENVEAGFPIIIYASSGNYNPTPNPNGAAINSIIDVLKDLKGVNETNYVQIIQMMDLYNSLPPEDQEQVVYKKRFFNGYNVALAYAATLGMPAPETPVEGGATGEVVTEQSAAEQGLPESGTM